MKSRSLVAIGALVAACQPAPQAPVTPTLAIPPPPPPSSAQPIAAPEPILRPGSDLALRICGDKQPCVIRRERSAGVDREGRRLFVVSVYRGREVFNEGDDDEDTKAVIVTPTSPGAPIGLVESGSGDTISPTLFHYACHIFEYWLVVREGAAITATQPLARICNEGHGAAGVGEDVTSIGDNRFEYDQYGGSNWRWSRHDTVELSPLRVLKTSGTGEWTLGANESENSWDWDELEDHTEWYSPPCDASGNPPATSPGSAPSHYAFAAIPQLKIDDAYLASAWKTKQLGRCAMRVHARGEGGFLIQGSAGEYVDSELRAVAVGDSELFVEVHDDRPVGPSAKWANDDRLELWLAKAHPGYMDHCLTPGEAPRQWIVRVADGKVFAGAGKARASEIAVERVTDGNTITRFRIRLPAGHKGVTVAYADVDDGRTTERVLATSELTPNDSMTLGERRPIDPSVARCVIDGDALTTEIRPPQPGKPILE